jgi:molecular chaperone DnaK (HSP70)
MMFTKLTMSAARKRGYTHFDQIVLVGGSTRMPQVSDLLDNEFHLPLRLFEPDEAVAKGAALYGQRLFLQHNIRFKAAEMQAVAEKVTNISSDAERIIQNARNSAGSTEAVEIPLGLLKKAQAAVAHSFNVADETINKLTTSTITNVASHSFGVIATIDHGTAKSRKVISNLVRVNDPLPITQTKTYGTIEAEQETVVLTIMETTEETWIVEPEKFSDEAEIGTITLTLPANLPESAPIEVTIEMNTQGRLHITGREPHSNTVIETTFETKGAMTKEELQEARVRSQQIKIL